jgi:hypothetical protein
MQYPQRALVTYQEVQASSCIWLGDSHSGEAGQLLIVPRQLTVLLSPQQPGGQRLPKTLHSISGQGQVLLGSPRGQWRSLASLRLGRWSFPEGEMLPSLRSRRQRKAYVTYSSHQPSKVGTGPVLFMEREN